MKLFIILITLLPLNLFTRECLDDAWKHYNEQEYNIAINSINSCLDRIIADADPKEMDYAFRGLSSNYIKLGIIDSAFKYNLVALNIEENNDLNPAISLNEIGARYTEIGLNHQAIYYLRKAHSLNIQNNDLESANKNLNNISVAFMNLGMLDSAEFYLRKLQSTTKENKNIKFEILNNLSFLFFEKSNLVESMKYSIEAIKNFPHDVNLHDSLQILTNFELIRLLNNETLSMDNLIIYEKLESNNRNSTYFADVNYKLSILKSKQGKRELSIKHLNNAVNLYVSLGDIIRAKQITNTFVEYSNYLVVDELDFTISKLNELQLVMYSKQLENDIETRISSDSYILEIENEIQHTKLSLYLSISIILSMLLTIGFIIYRIRSSNHIKRLVHAYNNYLDIIYQLDSKRLKTNLTKINNYMVLDKSFQEKKYFTDLISEVVVDTNKIRSTVKNGIIFQQNKRLNNGKYTTTK